MNSILQLVQPSRISRQLLLQHFWSDLEEPCSPQFSFGDKFMTKHYCFISTAFTSLLSERFLESQGCTCHSLLRHPSQMATFQKSCEHTTSRLAPTPIISTWRHESQFSACVITMCKHCNHNDHSTTEGWCESSTMLYLILFNPLDWRNL